MRFIITAILLVCVGAASAQVDSLPRVPIDTTGVVEAIPVDEGVVQNDGPSLVNFSASPSIGVTFQNIDNTSEDEILTVQWLASLQARFGYEGEPFQFNSSLYAQYGQLVTKEASPLKTYDDLIVTVVPSVTISDQLGLRLFFEVTGETDMGKGIVDDTIATSFLDPLFLYETIFLGHKINYQSDDGTKEFQLTLGVGYAFQQTVTKDFILEQNRSIVLGQNNPLQSVQDQFTLDNGYSGVFDLYYQNAITDELHFKTSLKTVVLTKKEFFDDVKFARVGSLLLTGISYSFVSIDYSLRIVYDNNISSRRQLEQALVFGLRFDL